jgi:pimeloyl-ACP methyl ester carboxylesterase
MPEAAGHGGSDTPLAAAAGLDERCRDVIALADNFGIRRFHFAGYSMGGWIGTGLARSCPQRLLSLAIAGWDPIDGARHFTRLAGEEDRRREFEHLLNRLIVGKPSLVGAARREFYAVTYLRMFSDVPSLMWLATGLQPLMLAVGADDPYAMSVRHAADALGADFQVLPGDHLTAFGALELGTSILDWLRSQTSQFSMSTPATTRP